MISVSDSEVVYGMNWEIQKTDRSASIRDEINQTPEYNQAIDFN